MSSVIDKRSLVWKSEFNIGDFRVDNEHQSLFVLAKKALYTRDVLNDEKAEIELKSIIRSLYEYVAVHFKNEEKYMATINYPRLDHHKKIHVTMLQTLHEFVNSLNSLTLDEIEKQLFNFIRDYFIVHITQEDIDIGIWKQPLTKLQKYKYYQGAYSVGNDHLDFQHKQLFDLASEAFMTSDDLNREEKLKTILTKLYEFMHEHFVDEEKFMESIHYPYKKEHYEIHRQILKDCNKLLLTINDIDEELFEKELAVFIDRHISEHIINEDHKIIMWYRHNKEKKK